MESLNVYKDILTKFGHAHVVLSYYGASTEVKRLMLRLSLTTRKHWIRNRVAYENSIPPDRENVLEI
jgi:hypothetical protein